MANPLLQSGGRRCSMVEKENGTFLRGLSTFGMMAMERESFLGGERKREELLPVVSHKKVAFLPAVQLIAISRLVIFAKNEPSGCVTV